MEKKNYAILDVMKFISAFLVIAIHCAPFVQIDETLNFAYVQILARLAVPFFFITAGFLFFRGINPAKGSSDPENKAALKHYWVRIFKVYVIWTILYLPLNLFSWLQGGFDTSTLFRFLRDFLFTGSYYHLWFLPSLLLGIPLVYWMYTHLSKRVMLCSCTILYLIGMGINVYGVVWIEQPIIGSILKGYEAIFYTARNGIFFAPIFCVLGIYAQPFLTGTYKKQAGFAFLLSFIGLACEATWLRSVHIMQELTSMYLMLLPCIFFLFLFLLQWDFKMHPVYKKLRQMSLLIYVSHIYFVFLFLNVLQLPNLLVYVLSILVSCVFAYGVLFLRKKLAFLRHFY